LTQHIKGYLIEERLNESTGFYSLVRKEGVVPVSFTFTALFKACGAKTEWVWGGKFIGKRFWLGGLVRIFMLGIL
jgi:hypothetical protein